jgi:hypothetical protein
LREAQIAQGLESLQRIGVELSRVINARQPRAHEKIVGKDLVPECHHLARLREEAVASDVEEEAFVGDGPADSADIMLVLFDDEHAMAGLGEIVGGRQPGGTSSDNQSVDRLQVAGFSARKRTVEG